MTNIRSYPGDGQGQAIAARSGRRNGLGVAALVLGIISIPGILTVFVGIILGILALIFGGIGIGRARRGEATNRGQALAGMITGAIGLVVSIVILAIGASFFATHTKQFHTYSQCLNNATTAHARQVCANQFGRSLTH
ncbi:MAG: DUF4190 domain-containing protein [Acidimicrobiales bacterium]